MNPLRVFQNSNKIIPTTTITKEDHQTKQILEYPKTMTTLSVLLLVCLHASAASAFVTQRRHTKAKPLHLLFANPALVKKSGGGVPLVDPGDCLLFDPGQAGKLGGTHNLEDRIQQSYNYLSVTVPPVLDDCQHFLETDDNQVPPVFAKPTQPVEATVLGRGRLIGDDAQGDIEHIVLQLPEGFRYVEGQSLSVIPPGVDPNNNKPHKPRLYSIASTRYGDLLDGRTVSLCVRRALYYDPTTQLEDTSKQGVCSNFLCDTNVGDTVQVAGPVGKTMLLPSDPNTDLIMVATGTGVAPFRGFLHRLFVETTVARHMFNGHAWLILGVPTSSNLLYHDELSSMQNNDNDGNHQLEITYAISREMTNQQGGKLYVQDVLAERSAELFDKLDSGAVIYFCGLKGMMPGILEALQNVATSRGLDWNVYLSKLKENHQWHVEVY